MGVDYSALILKCENWIRSGQSAICVQELRKLNFSKIPRGQLAEICALGRRSGAPDLGLRALRPLVRTQNPSAKKATSAETIEYARELLRMGAFAEANELLNLPGVAGETESILSRAFACMYQWDYQSALNHFDQYLLRSDVKDYWRLTARVNRLTCLNSLGNAGFSSEFEDLKKALEIKKYNLLLANILETMAQHNIDKEQWHEAGSALNTAERLLEGENSRNSHFVQKWKKILNAVKNRSLKDLQNFREQSLAVGEWETVRALDYHQTRIDPSNPFADRLYFGTPYPIFRRKLEKIRDFPVEAWIGGGVEKFDPWFPGSGEGQLSHRLTVFCLRDLYRPFPTSELFAALHFDEHFDIDRINLRMRQLVLRTRRWLEKMNAPVSLEFSHGSYSLRIQHEGSVLLRSTSLPNDELSFFFKRYEGFAEPPQTTAEWSKVMGVSSGNASKFLNSAVKMGKLVKVRRGKLAYFKIK